MLLQITHTTSFHYSLPARSSINELRLSPEDTSRQTPGDTIFQIEPTTELTFSRDLFGNLVHHFEIEEKHPALIISAISEVETFFSPHPPLSLFDQEVIDASANDDTLRDFLSESDCILRDPGTWREAVDIHSSSDGTWSGLLFDLSQHIFTTCAYREQKIHVMRNSSDVQRERFGTCQDFAHLLTSYLRLLQIPARYCSGYLYDPGLDGSDTPELIGSGTTHAWVEAHHPVFGWVGIDPTNNCWVNDHYVSIAFGRDYHDVVPIRGSFLGGGKNRELEVSITVKSVQ
jgi:transglutaminase-like putative cysteine protease